MSEAASVEVESVTAKAETSDNKDVESKPSQLPEPSGYKILIALP